MSLTGKWIDLIYRVATGGWRTRLIIAPIVGMLYLSLIAVFVLLSLIVDQSLHFAKAVCSPLSLIIGFCLGVSGLFLMLLSITFFLRVRGTPVPFSPPPELVTTGPYKFARNPMLTGIFMQLFGLGIALGSISLVFIFTPLFIIINVWELKKIEEPELVKRLGQDYEEYKKRVPMFFPLCIKRLKILERRQKTS
ncbi:MAG: isoprenylcysteine carboxylmethyltransferase family protein [Smithella sp.]